MCKVLPTSMHLLTLPPFRPKIFFLGEALEMETVFFWVQVIRPCLLKVCAHCTIWPCLKIGQMPSNRKHFISNDIGKRQKRTPLTTNRDTITILEYGLGWLWHEMSEYNNQTYKNKAQQKQKRKEVERNAWINKKRSLTTKKCMSSKSLFGIRAFFSLSSWAWCNSI